MKEFNRIFQFGLLSALSVFFFNSASSQGVLENVTVETYYISNADDAATTVGGTLDEGSVTYRVFITICEGCNLRAMYGSVNHPFSITSTELFFNNTDRGKTWGYDIQDNRLDENTVALDSWLGFGGATDEHWGVLKSMDDNGSIIGGANHEDGLLVNNASAIGILLPEADGLLPASATAPSNFFQSGTDPSAVFGIETIGNAFESTTFRAQFDPMNIPETGNTFLVAQLTTKGDLTFDLNFEIENANGQLVKVVSSDEILEADEVFSAFLSYPLSCGCTDPYYLEFDATAACDDGSCVTEIVYGCSDPEACNYDPDVNFNVPQLCCILPDNCVGLDSDVLCPGIVGIEDVTTNFSVNIYPNPTNGLLNLELEGNLTSVDLRIIGMRGEIIVQRNLQASNGQIFDQLDISGLANGFYTVQLIAPTSVWNTRILKSE